MIWFPGWSQYQLRPIRTLNIRLQNKFSPLSKHYSSFTRDIFWMFWTCKLKSNEYSRPCSNIERKSLNNTYLNIIELLFILITRSPDLSIFISQILLLQITNFIESTLLQYFNNAPLHVFSFCAFCIFLLWRYVNLMTGSI